MRDPPRGLKLVPTFSAMSISSRRPSSGTAASITEGPSQLGGSGTALVRHAASAAVVDQHFSDVEAELDRVPAHTNLWARQVRIRIGSPGVGLRRSDSARECPLLHRITQMVRGEHEARLQLLPARFLHSATVFGVVSIDRVRLIQTTPLFAHQCEVVDPGRAVRLDMAECRLQDRALRWKRLD